MSQTMFRCVWDRDLNGKLKFTDNGEPGGKIPNYKLSQIEQQKE